MAQYTTSVKSLIELEAYKNNTPIKSIDDYITIGRNLFFNFTYDGNNIFKEYFEKKFILYYLEESINNDFPPLWVQYLASAVQTSAPYYFLKWQSVNVMTLDKILSDGVRITDIDKEGNNSGDDKTTTNGNTLINDKTVDSFTGSQHTVGDEDTTHTGNNTSTTTINDSASATGSSLNKNSAFPSNLDITTSLNSVNYAVDGGKVESTNSSTNTGTHATTDHISETNNTDIDTTVTTNNTDTRTSAGSNQHNQSTVNVKSGKFDETEHINEQLTGNILDKVIKMYDFSFDIIDEYVKSFRNLFMYIW